MRCTGRYDAVCRKALVGLRGRGHRPSVAAYKERQPEQCSLPAACEKTNARQGGELSEAERISFLTRTTLFVRSHGMLLGEPGMKSIRIKVGAAVAFLILLVGVVSAPATAFENPPPKKYQGYAWLDCRKGNGPEFKGPINGKGGGVCDQAPNKVIFIKGCGSESNPAKCPLVEVSQGEQVYEPTPACWEAAGGNNCPVENAIRFDAPTYAMVGVPFTMRAYATVRPDENGPAEITNGTAVIRVNGEDYAGVEFVDGVAEWRFVPEVSGTKVFTVSEVAFSGYTGAEAYVDTVPGTIEVLPYDPSAYVEDLKDKAVDVGDKYTIVDEDQAESVQAKRLEWNVSKDSQDVCAVYETKKGEIKIRFTEEGKCTVNWSDSDDGETGEYTFEVED